MIGWGVGGIETETVLLGNPLVVPKPSCVGVRLTGRPRPGVLAADVALAVTELLRREAPVGAFVEFAIDELGRREDLDDDLVDGQASSQYGKRPKKFAYPPQLLLVDGGKGQLARAVAVVERFGLSSQLFVASLAKQHEEIFTPGRAESILLPRQSQGLYLVQRVRDEAHRYAITSHRQRRDKAGIASRLDGIPGIGPSRRKALLRHFGGIPEIQQASLEELQKVAGITIKLAQAIKDHLA